MRAFAAGSLGLAMAVLSAAVAVTAPVTAGPLRFPDQVGGFTLGGSTVLERTTPGQGTMIEYTRSGWRLEVNAYDLRRRAIPDDAKSAIVRAEFERSREDAFLAAPRGPFAQVFLRRNFTIEDGGKRTRFQCAAFHMTREGAKPQDGFLCVTALRNTFVKLRLVTLAEPGTEAQARTHVAAFIPVLWGGSPDSEPPRRRR